MIGTDLFELKGVTYLLVVDYFSENSRITSTTSLAVINVLQSIFARHGISEVIRSDNGPQYASQGFAQFAESYGFQHLISSPHHPQSNGYAQMSQCSLPCTEAQQNYWWERRLRTCIPQVEKQLVPKWPYLMEFIPLNQKLKQKQKQDFDKRTFT